MKNEEWVPGVGMRGDCDGVQSCFRDFCDFLLSFRFAICYNLTHTN